MEVMEFNKRHAYQILKDRTNSGLLLTELGDWEAEIKKWGKGPAYTILHEEHPIMCAGVVLLGWKQGEAWTLFGPDFRLYHKSCFGIIRDYLDRIARDHQLRRVQSYTLANFFPGHHFLHHLGFEWEGWPRAAGPNNEDLFLFGKVYSWK